MKALRQTVLDIQVGGYEVTACQLSSGAWLVHILNVQEHNPTLT